MPVPKEPIGPTVVEPKWSVILGNEPAIDADHEKDALIDADLGDEKDDGA